MKKLAEMTDQELEEMFGPPEAEGAIGSLAGMTIMRDGKEISLSTGQEITPEMRAQREKYR